MQSLDFLEKRVSQLGNYYRKYLITIEKYKDALHRRLEKSGQLMQVHLWRSSFSPSEEMRLISQLSREEATRVQDLSCYYALQFLHMNFRHLDILSLGFASDLMPARAYHQFLMHFGSSFRELTTAYIENLLNLYLPKKTRPEFFVISVGTRVDQDDIDLGIIVEDGGTVEGLNRAFRKITQHMLVYATPLHLYLSENVGKQDYTTTISEYEELLSSRVQNVVIISELLNARFMLGSKSLFDRFYQRVISKYFYGGHSDSRYHEGFIRGILGEARALLISPPQMDAVAPKYDAIRILKSLLYAKKTIHNLNEVNAFDIIDVLKAKEPHFKTQYEMLFKAGAFLEMFKFMLQLYVVQEEKFRLDEIDEQQLTLMAERMGYRPIGMVNAWDQLLIDYYRYVREVRELSDQFIDDITRHLKSISIFRELFEHNTLSQRSSSVEHALVRQLIIKARFFGGVKYWEDLLGILETSEHAVEAFIASYYALPVKQQEEVIGWYVSFARYSQITLLRLIAIIGKAEKNQIGRTFFQQMNAAYLDLNARLPNALERLCRVFSYFPQYIHAYLQYMPEDQAELLENILSKPVPYDELKEYQRQLWDLFHIHRWSSKYFHRFFNRIIADHPEYLDSLNDFSQLYKISQGLLGLVDILPNPHEKKKILGDYYDLEFLRVGIGTMRGVQLHVTNQEFTLFCDNYIKKLFDTCTEEIMRASSGNFPNTESFAILAAGGHARGQAYDDDYDLIAVVDTDDKQVIAYSNRIIARMNREILKRGLLPHYRLGEILGSFVCPVSKIVDYLQSDAPERFIDLSQLLGARMIIGSEVMESVLHEKVLKPFVFHQKKDYVMRMIREIKNRQRSITADEPMNHCNIKEAPGGLRDIEATALMLKAYSESSQPLKTHFLTDMAEHLPAIGNSLKRLTDNAALLRTIRNLYRITEAAEDHIYREYLNHLAVIFQQNNQPELGSSERIFDTLKRTLQSSAVVSKRIMTYLEKQLAAS